MNKYDEILSQYIDSNSIYSYAQEPFLQTDHIITTNGMYLIRVPAELCEGVYQLRKYPDMHGVVANIYAKWMASGFLAFTAIHLAYIFATTPCIS